MDHALEQHRDAFGRHGRERTRGCRSRVAVGRGRRSRCPFGALLFDEYIVLVAKNGVERKSKIVEALTLQGAQDRRPVTLADGEMVAASQPQERVQ